MFRDFIYMNEYPTCMEVVYFGEKNNKILLGETVMILPKYGIHPICEN